MPLEIGRGRIVKEGTSIALLNFGGRLAECLKAAQELGAYGLSTTVADARFAKPLDTDLIDRLVREHEVVITIEEGSIGGFGSHVLHHLATTGQLDHGLKIRPMVLPDVSSSTIRRLRSTTPPGSTPATSSRPRWPRWDARSPNCRRGRKRDHSERRHLAGRRLETGASSSVYLRRRHAGAGERRLLARRPAPVRRNRRSARGTGGAS